MRHMRATSVVAAVCLLASAGSLEATSLVAVHAGDRLIIASDSRRLWGSGKVDTMCKVRQAGGCFFSIAGAARTNDLASQACDGGGDVDAVLDRFTKLAEPEFLDTYNHTKRYKPELLYATEVLDVVLIGRRGGQTTMVGQRMTPRGDGTVEVSRQEYSFSRVMGRPEMVKRAISETPDPDNWARWPEYVARRIVELEIGSGRADVGPPISVLEVNASGPKWIDPGLCPPIDPKLWR